MLKRPAGRSSGVSRCVVAPARPLDTALGLLRNLLALSIALLLGACASSAPLATVVQHRTVLLRSDCPSYGPRSRAEEERVDAKWLDDGTLEVGLWEFESGDDRRQDAGASAVLTEHGSLALTLSWRKLPPPPPDIPESGCSFPVRVTFNLSIPRSAYGIEVYSKGGLVRRGRIEA